MHTEEMADQKLNLRRERIDRIEVSFVCTFHMILIIFYLFCFRLLIFCFDVIASPLDLS